MIGESQAYALRALNDAFNYLYTCWQQAATRAAAPAG
jgi:hypothetical protein